MHTTYEPNMDAEAIVDQDPLVWMAEINGLLVNYAKRHVRCR